MNRHASILAQSKSKHSKLSSDEVQAAETLLGTMGGQVGGPARANALSSSHRLEIARHAINQRWGNPYAPSCQYCK